MIEVSVNMLIQLFKLIPFVILLVIIFDFLGSFFFGKR